MKINDLEKEIDISNLKYDDFNPWPLIRFKLLKSITFNQSSKNFNYKTEIKKDSYIKKIIIICKSFLHYIRNPIVKDKIDILYFTKSYETKKNLDNKYYSQYSNPLVHFAGKELNIKILELNKLKSLKKREYAYHNTVSIDFIKYLPLIKAKLKMIFRIRKKSTNINLLKDELDIINLEKDLTILNETSKSFEIILKKLNPKVVYLVCFYDMYSMAISLACHRLKIKVVEYQHGFLNDYYSMYTNWNNLPSQGYELIPDIFWMWSNENKQSIDKWANKTTKHRAIVGGNMWISYNKKVNSYNNLDKTSKKKNILVILQFSPLPEFFMNYLKNNKDKFNWYFRMHPLHPIPIQLKNLLECFAKESIDITSDRDLYKTFTFIDANITMYSSVGFEAQVYNVPTIFMGENAKYGFKNLLGKNGLYYAQNELDLTSYLNNFDVISKIDNFYIECDEAKIKNVIKKILNI